MSQLREQLEQREKEVKETRRKVEALTKQRAEDQEKMKELQVYFAVLLYVDFIIIIIVDVIVIIIIVVSASSSSSSSSAWSSSWSSTSWSSSSG